MDNFRAVTLIALTSLGMGYSGIMGLIYLNQDNMVFVPSRQVNLTPKAVGLKFESVQLTTADRLRLAGWWIPSADPASYVLLFCHGNGGNISHRLDYALLFHQMGLSSFHFDYRGYGNSEGTPTEAGLYLDAIAAWEYLTQVRQIPPHQIIIYGESLGGGVASYLATEKPAAGLILASTFTSLTDRAKEIYPFLPVNLLSKYKFNTYDRLPQIKMPVLVMHSRADMVIPYHHGEKLFERANQPKVFLELQGDHNKGFLDSGKIYTEGILDFINKTVAGTASHS
ncbi:MAG: alpha/beta hydrolase [Pseudanabaenaceae cyanobacterium SKYGB_i_bin29]|nr:alpha/beta hydrolase [Pseudanabaenaceae cyanobacterium SKYG29]MDW8420784.1 alpha/beta hydrolase [Pseudanabaenaceae cyanobacterium SKYGB_i_bin29]